MAGNGKKLRIGLLTYRGNMFCGGQGVYVVNLARALVARGHRVKVLSGPPYPAPVAGAEAELVPDENFINKPASALPGPDPLSTFSPLTFLEYGLARAGANPEMLAFSLRCFARIRRQHGFEPFDVIHDNQGLGYGLLLLRALGIPVVATIHHPLQVDRAEDLMQTNGLLAKIKRSIYYPIVMQKLVAQRLSRIITVSEFSRELVARTYGLDRERIAVAPNGVDADFFRPLQGVGRAPGRLLFVGSTEDRKKGVIYLLEALAELPPEFRLAIVDGRRYPGRVYAAEAVARLGLSDRVEFKDKIGNEELAIEYNRAEIMVMPSLFEGFGLPALEAMACGTPLICTSAGALSEVADGDCALLVKPRSAAALRQAVLRLDHDPQARRRMALAGRKRALEKFTWAAAAQILEKQYWSAIEDGRRALASGTGRDRSILPWIAPAPRQAKEGD